MVDQVTFTPNRALTANITASAGARARFYETGTTTPVVVYQDAAGSVVRSQPVEASASGVFPQVFYTAAGAVKAVVTAADESALYTIDPVPLTPVAAGAASATSFVPATSIPSTNVQAAIEQVQSNISAQTVNGQTIVQTGGAAGAYTLTAAQTITAYAAGQRFVLRINHENTGAATLSVDGLSVQNLQKYVGGSLVALAANDLRTGDLAEVAFDGTRFVLLANADGVTRNYVETAAIATRGPIPTASAGAGQWVNISAGDGVALTLPAGGTWAYKATIYNNAGEFSTGLSGVAAGGTALTGTTIIKDGVAWRIT